MILPRRLAKDICEQYDSNDSSSGTRMLQAIQIALIVAGFSVCTQASSENLRYNCNFPIFADSDGLGAAKDFTLEFNRDSITNDAFMVGNNGTSNVLSIDGHSGVTFLELLSSGAVQTTTISSDSSAVHSRHTMVGPALVPSQYYGTCIVQ